MSDLFDFSTEVPRFAVMGNPVNHSRSPWIHARFGKDTGIALDYTAIQVDVGGFDQAVDAFRAGGGRGLNITVPFKTEAWSYADERTPGAELAGAVNTLYFETIDAPVQGENTDGNGLLRDIAGNLGVTIAGQRVLFLGAGGATRGAIEPIAGAKPAELVIANRTPDRAAEVANSLNPSLPITVEGCGLDDVSDRTFDIVINATAASLSDDVPAIVPSVVQEAVLAYDMMYAPQPTAFMNWCGDAGVQNVHDGLGMLVEQAALSFGLWHGQVPETADVIKDLRKTL